MEPIQNILAARTSSETRIHISIPPFVPLIVGASLVLAAVIGSYAFYAVHALDNVIAVTGSAKTRVVADTVKWRISIVRKVSEQNMASGYPLLAKDLGVVQGFLKTNNVPDEAVAVSTVFVEEIFNYNSSGNALPRQFNLRQEIMVNSSDVKGIDALSKNISQLADKGIFIYGNGVEFYVSNLAELRVSLLADAVKDAKARATELAKAGDKSVGALKAASSGVVQVLAPNSIEVSDYGTYDTQSIEKEVMVTARATFFVR